MIPLFRLLLGRRRGLLLLALAVGLVSGVTNTGVILVLLRMLRKLVDPAGTAPLAERIPGSWALLFVGVTAVALTTGTWVQRLMTRLSFAAVEDLRMHLSRAILATPLARLEEVGNARLLAVLSEDVQGVARVLPSFARVVIDGTTLAVGVAWIGWISPLALAALLVLLGVGALLYRRVVFRAMRFMQLGRVALDQVFEHFRALGEGIKQLKLNARRREAFFAREYRPALDEATTRNVRGRTTYIAADTLTRLLFFLLLGSMILVVPRFRPIDPAVLSAVFAATLFLYRPFGSIMTMVPEFGRATVALDRIRATGSLLQGGPRDGEAELPPPAAPTFRRVDLRGVTYTYRRDGDDSHFTVGPVDLTLHAGEILFLVGGNGSGKTTLAKVLTGLYEPDAGTIEVDGVPVTDATRAAYRELFAAVFGDFHLFRTLVAADGAAVDAEAAACLRRFELDHKVEVRDGVLSRTALSQGQRKRLALLQAYLEDRPIYLFDEWAADQDPHFKKVFYETLLPQLKARGRTVVAITHDDRWFAVADRCIKLDEGRVVAPPILEEASPKP